MAYTEFYVQTTASNLNAGSTNADAAVYTSPANGGWNSGTGVFTPVSGNPSLTVSVGMFASVYLDAATVTNFVGRVTAVSSTTITVSITAKSGTIPTTAGTGLTCKVGGAWAGPAAAVGFPFGFVSYLMSDSTGNHPRVNVKGGAAYNITAAMTHSVAGAVRFHGYTTTVADGGKAIIDGGTTGGNYTLLTAVGGAIVEDFIFRNNGASGSLAFGVVAQNDARFIRCVFTGIRGSGAQAQDGGATFIECEAYGNNLAAAADRGGFVVVTRASFIRCISHSNTGSNSSGWVFTASATTGIELHNCIAHSNGSHGVSMVSTAANGFVVSAINCDFYNNGGSGISVSQTGTGALNLVVESCNFLKNAAYGISASKTSGSLGGSIRNNGYGTGTQANTSGATSLAPGMEESGAVTYASGVTPWNAPTTGDFRITLAAAKNTGRGAFTQTASGQSGTVAYPDIGAGQHIDSGGGSGGGECSFVFIE